MKYNAMKRRMFLQGTAATLAIPFLPSLVRAQSTSTKPFFIFFPWNQGYPRAETWPLNQSVGFTNFDGNTKYRSLLDIIAADGKLSQYFGTDWNSYAPYMNLFTHLNMYGSSDEHSSITVGCAQSKIPTVGKFLGGNIPVYEQLREETYSIDHLVLKAFERQSASQLSSIMVNIGKNDELSEYDHFSWGANNPMVAGSSGQAYNHIDNIQKLELLVQGVTSNQKSSNQSKLIDLVLEDYNRVINDRRLSSVDKVRLENAVDQWNDIQNRSAQISCSLPSSVGSTTNYTIQNKQTVDIITAAISCGMTQVATQVMIQAGSKFLGDGEIHDLAHGSPGCKEGFLWRLQFMKQYADRLTSLKDGNGESLMKSGLLYSSTEYSSFGMHPMLGRMVITLGQAGGRWKSGYHVHCGGAPFQRSHISVMKALGVTQSEMEYKGSAGFGEYVSTNNKEWDDDMIERTGRREEYTFQGSDLARFSSNVEKRKAYDFLIS